MRGFVAADLAANPTLQRIACYGFATAILS
jgi:hypothetical protein